MRLAKVEAQLIMQCFEKQDLIRFARTCRTYYGAANDAFAWKYVLIDATLGRYGLCARSNWRPLVTGLCRRATFRVVFDRDVEPSCIDKCLSHLRVVSVETQQLKSVEQWERVLQLAHLESLHVGSTDFLEIAHRNSPANIIRLNMGRVELRKQEPFLAQLTTLRHLEFISTHDFRLPSVPLDKSFYASIAACTQLQSLKIRVFDGLAQQLLMPFLIEPNLSTITSLSLEYPPGLCSTWKRVVENFPLLQTLYIKWCGTYEECLTQAVHIPTLRSLQFDLYEGYYANYKRIPYPQLPPIDVVNQLLCTNTHLFLQFNLFSSFNYEMCVDDQVKSCQHIHLNPQRLVVNAY